LSAEVSGGRKGADYTLKNAYGENAVDLAVKCSNAIYLYYLGSFQAGTPKTVAELATSDD